nr:glycoside hydrolase family 3 N-terminal domain-containing protein [Tessaracoccus sp. OS52]
MAPQPISCVSAAAELPLQAQVGQLYMVGVSTAGLDEVTSAAITQTQVGSVVLLGNSTAGSEAILELTGAVGELADPALPILVAVDQEGGAVQRLQGPGFSDLPTALDQARFAEGELEKAANEWGEELAATGVLFNLAPVADVVPADKQESNAPIGALRRNYGNDADTTSGKVAEFVTGMTDAGVATSLKHFPGLGQVTTNTDFDVAVDTDVAPGDSDWAPFVAGIDAGAKSVMVSSGIFKLIDPAQEGVFSPTIITSYLREHLAFDGVVIADDLGAAGAVADTPPADRGVRFITAGGDIVINADPAILQEMVAATVAKAQADPAFAEQVAASTARVLTLKAWLGLVQCS